MAWKCGDNVETNDRYKSDFGRSVKGKVVGMTEKNGQAVLVIETRGTCGCSSRTENINVCYIRPAFDMDEAKRILKKVCESHNELDAFKKNTGISNICGKFSCSECPLHRVTGESLCKLIRN